MMTPSPVISDNKFPIIQQLDSGQWLYFFDRAYNEEFNYYVSVCCDFGYTKPTYKEAVEKVIRLYLSSSEEFDLINSAYQGDDTEYKEWLVKLKEIKTKIRKDFEEYEQTH